MDVVMAVSGGLRRPSRPAISSCADAGRGADDNGACRRTDQLWSWDLAPARPGCVVTEQVGGQKAAHVLSVVTPRRTLRSVWLSRHDQ